LPLAIAKSMMNLSLGRPLPPNIVILFS